MHTRGAKVLIQLVTISVALLFSERTLADHRSSPANGSYIVKDITGRDRTAKLLGINAGNRQDTILLAWQLLKIRFSRSLHSVASHSHSLRRTPPQPSVSSGVSSETRHE